VSDQVLQATLERDLREGAARLGLSLDDAQVNKLLAYLDMIAKWNKVYNLTAVRAVPDMLRQHLVDSLAVLPLLVRHLESSEGGEGAGRAGPNSAVPQSLLDVGSGAGLPGVVFAICMPTLRVTCVDTVGKKAAFIQQVAVNLGLPNLKALNTRVETLRGADFNVVCSRAFASLRDFTTWSRDALSPQGVWMAMKGKHPADEIAALADRVEVFHVEQVTVPGLDAERCVIWMRRR
jgi:16S rRNA (guanine527-N7)-methyltransferase